MKRLLLLATLIPVLCLMTAHAARAQAVPVDQGQLKAGTYTNDFFGVSFSIPESWIAQDMATKQAIMNTGKDVIRQGSSQQKMEALEASMKRVYFLLSASKYELGKSGPAFNAQLACMAERVPTALVKTGEDYLTGMINITQGTAAKIELNRPMRREKVGGVFFTVADVTLTTPAGVSAQRYYVTIRKSHALLIGFTYVDEVDLKTFDDTIKSVRFK